MFRKSKNLSVATDIGIFNSTNNGITWLELAEGLPLSPVIDIDYLPYLKIMRAATFGMGVWQVKLDGDIYITDNENLPSGVTIDKNIIVCNGGVLNFVGGVGTVKFTQGKQITVLNGGKITGNSNATFYGDGVSWNGIVIEPGGEADLDNCFFDQTSTPITINGDAFVSSPQVSITNCTFFCNNAGVGAININNRNNVIIENNTWAYPNNSNLQRIAINTINSSDLLINNNQFNFNTLEDANFSAISVDYGNNVIISNNKIYKLAKGITILNCSPFVFRNEIIYPLTPSIFQSYGITLSNSYSSNLKQNNITNYGTGIKLQNSSPLLFENDFINNLEEATALVCETNSSPRLRPQESGGQTIWDAGKNEFEALYTYQNVNYGSGVFLNDYSIPDFNYGCNIFNTSSYNITGDIADCLGLYYYLFARNNTWNVNHEDVCDADWETFPPGCNEGSGGSENENDPPPQPIVINYGNGIYDTIQVTARNVQVNTDQALYLSANNDEITGNFTSAISKYEQVIQDYQDSLTAVNSLRKLLHCKDKMNADTTAYSQLRAYYQAKIQANLTDTVFVNVAEELAAKCLVRIGKPTNAIDEYEVIISNTNDSAKILCAELNIIETYLIIQNSGDSPNYTGQLGYLKPAGKEDAYKKIMDRLHKNKKDKSNINIPKIFKLSQNYPNPFNPITKINYSLPRAVKVNIQVYDILGRLVKTLVNENKDAGNYEVQFDGTGLASGVYFYRIEAGEFKDSKKMVLVK
ncbi:MAG: peptidase S8/S53 subtilisin kexin sedolisin [Chlorobi bacterium OLB5]|nr:MAG: peptidase S8/S53 subtilisin kexin sedolisin [Chlorobi bacterium OLB5]